MNTYPSIRVGIAGATGFAGQELVALLARHPQVKLEAAMSSSPDSAARPLPRLARIWDGAVEPLNQERLAKEMDLVFLAVPENAAATLAPPLVDAGVRVIDLSGAFRIRDASARARWYPATTTLPAGAAYGLTEHYKNDVRHASLVANPGCYPTGALLALLPLGRAGLLRLDADVIVDAKSGISGAGRAATDRTHFSENHGSVSAYGVFHHRHVAEMEQELGTAITFVPSRAASIAASWRRFYVRVQPGTTRGANRRHLSRPQERAVHSPDGRRAAGDQTRRGTNLRHRLRLDAATQPPGARQLSRQPREGAAGQAP